MIPGLTVFRDQDILAEAAAKFIVQKLSMDVAARRKANLVLSGGNTPRAVYEKLGYAADETGLDWRNVHLFWGDERCVPPDHPESNYRMVQESLLQSISIPEGNVHRIKCESSPADAATQYSSEMREHFSLKGDTIPSFDLVLLGTGEDGHVASIFPGSSAETEMDYLVTSTFVEKLQVNRITMTLPVLKNAAEILILVAGRAKARILRSLFLDENLRLPVHQIRSASGKVQWFADRDAASMLPEGIAE